MDFIERLIGTSLGSDNGMFEAFLIVAVVLTAVRAHFAARRTMKLRGNG